MSANFLGRLVSACPPPTDFEKYDRKTGTEELGEVKEKVHIYFVGGHLHLEEFRKPALDVAGNAT